MPVLFDVKCPSCGAPLPPPVEGKSTCSFCERTIAVQRTLAAIPAVPGSPAGGATKGAKRVIAAISVTMALIGGFTLLSSSRAVQGISPEQIVNRISGGSALAGAADVRMIWDDVGGPPVSAQIDGNEAVLGRLRTVTTGDELFIVATDSATLKKRWKAGPYGTYMEGFQSTHFVVIGDRVAVSDFHSKLHFLDLRTGKELASLPLSDRVQCMYTEKGRVRVMQADEKTLLIDPANQTTAEVPKRELRKRWDDPRCEGKSVERKSLATTGAPSVDGFGAYRVFVDGAEGIAAGKKTPGTPVPQVVGFEPNSKRVLWRQVLPSVDPNTVDGSSTLAGDLGGHRYVGVYPVGSEIHRLAAFDARSGARLWDVKLRPIFSVDHIEDIVVTENFVYAVRSSSLDVLDVKSGKLIGAIGDDTYDEEQ